MMKKQLKIRNYVLSILMLLSPLSGNIHASDNWDDSARLGVGIAGIVGGALAIAGTVMAVNWLTTPNDRQQAINASQFLAKVQTDYGMIVNKFYANFHIGSVISSFDEMRILETVHEQFLYEIGYDTWF